MKRFGYLISFSINFDDFTSLFTHYFFCNWEDTSNTQDSVSLAIQTPQISSKIFCCALCLKLSCQCLDIPKNTVSCVWYISYSIDPMHKWLQIKNSFVSIKISPTNLIFELINYWKEFLFSNEASWANLNAYKRILNWQPFMHRVYILQPRPTRAKQLKVKGFCLLCH